MDNFGRFSNDGEALRKGLRPLEKPEQEDKARPKWLLAAVKKGVDDIDRGDYTTLGSGQEIGGFVRRLRQEASGDPADVPGSQTPGV